VLFIVQNPSGRLFRANYETDPTFAAVLRRAARWGVQILAYRLVVDPGEMTVTDRIPVRLF